VTPWVPFELDTHALICSPAAVGLELRPHRHFDEVRVNLVARREFFHATPAEVRRCCSRWPTITCSTTPSKPGGGVASKLRPGAQHGRVHLRRCCAPCFRPAARATLDDDDNDEAASWPTGQAAGVLMARRLDRM